MVLIDADALKKQGWTMQRTVAVDFQTMETQIKKPTDFPIIEDAVLVVRCKDCKYFARIKDEKSGVIHSECIRTWAGITEHDFCSYGEREDDYGQCLPMSEKDFYTRSKFH